MSTSTVVSSFAGGSAVCAAAREVIAADTVEHAFGQCRNALACAAIAVARGEEIPAPQVREEPPAPQVNLTARWMQEHYTSVFAMLVEHLTLKMPRSRELAVVEDHVQTVLTRLVERDTLAPFLRDGKSVKPSVLRIWAYQSASTELRRWGADASTRMTRGAKTSREVKAGKEWRVPQSASPVREVAREREDTITTPDLHDPSEASPEDAVARRSRVDLVRRHLARIGQGHLVSAVEHVLNGGDVADLPLSTAAQLTTALRGLRA